MKKVSSLFISMVLCIGLNAAATDSLSLKQVQKLQEQGMNIKFVDKAPGEAKHKVAQTVGQDTTTTKIEVHNLKKPIITKQLSRKEIIDLDYAQAVKSVENIIFQLKKKPLDNSDINVKRIIEELESIIYELNYQKKII